MVDIAVKERAADKNQTSLSKSSFCSSRITTALTAAVVIASSCTSSLLSVLSRNSSGKLMQLALAQYSFETGMYNITLPEEAKARFEFAVEGNTRAFSEAFLRCASLEKSTLSIGDSLHEREGESGPAVDVSIISKGKDLAECDGTTKFRRCVVVTTESAATTQQVLINCKLSNMSSGAVFNFIKTAETSQSGPVCVPTVLEIVAGAGYGSLSESNAAASYLPLFTSFRLDASVPSAEPSVAHSSILSYTLSHSSLLPTMDSRDVRSTPFYQRSVRRRLLNLDTDPTTPQRALEEVQSLPIGAELSAPTKQTEATPTRLVVTSTSTTTTALDKQTPDAILEGDTFQNITSTSTDTPISTTDPTIAGITPTAGKSSSGGKDNNMPSPPPTVASAAPATRPTADEKSTKRVAELLFCRNLSKHADVVRISERDYFGPSVYPLALELDPSVVRGHPMPDRTASTLREAGCEPIASFSGVLGDAVAVNNGFFIVKRLEIALFAKESRNEKGDEKTQAWSRRLSMPFSAQSASRGKCGASIDFNVLYSKGTPESHTALSLTTPLSHEGTNGVISSPAFVLPVLGTRPHFSGNGSQSQRHILIPFELAAVAGSFYSNISSAPTQHVSASIVSGLSTCGRVLRVDNTTVTIGAAATPSCEGVLRIGAFFGEEETFSSVVYLPFVSADASTDDLSNPSSRTDDELRGNNTSATTAAAPTNSAPTNTSAATATNTTTATYATSTTKGPVTTESPPLATSTTSGPSVPPKKEVMTTNTTTATTATSTTESDDWGEGGGEDDTNEEDDNEYGEEWGDEDETPSGPGEVKAKTTTTRKSTSTTSPKKEGNIEGKTTTTREPKTTGVEDDEGETQEQTTKPTTTTTGRIFSHNYGNTDYQKSGAASMFSSLLTFVFFAVPVACLAYFRRDVAAFANRLRGYVGINLNGDDDGSGGAERRRGAAVGGRARKGSTATAIQIDRGECESSSEEDERQSIPMKMIRASSSTSPAVVTNNAQIDFSGNNASSKPSASAPASGSAAASKKRLLAEPAITTRPSVTTASTAAGWDDEDGFLSDAKSDKEQTKINKSKAAAAASSVNTSAVVGVKPLMKPNLAKKNDEVTAPKPSLSLTSKLGAAKVASKDGKEDLLGAYGGSGQLALHGSPSSIGAGGGGGAMRLGGRVGGLGLGASNRATSAVVAPLKPSLNAKPAAPTSVRSSSAGPQPPSAVPNSAEKTKKSSDAWSEDDDLFE